MGDYFLSPAEIAAMSLSREAVRPEFLSFLHSPWGAAADGGPGPPESDGPQLEIPPEPLDLRAFMHLVPPELLSLHRAVEGEDGGEVAPPRSDIPPNPGDLPSLMELLEPEEALPLHHLLVRAGESGAEARVAWESLERVVVGAGERCDRCCPICLEEMEVGSEARAMGCAHRYHEDCIFEWLRRRRSCPLCRYHQMPAG